jgi:hypothetical protein
MFGAFRARHTISGRKLKAGDLEPVRRIEEFTGAGQRREWPAKAKARIVAESCQAFRFVAICCRSPWARPWCRGACKAGRHQKGPELHLTFIWYFLFSSRSTPVSNRSIPPTVQGCLSGHALSNPR